MTVKELIEQLSYYSDDMEVAMLPNNSMYAHAIDDLEVEEVTGLYGGDFDAVVLKSEGQIGAV